MAKKKSDGDSDGKRSDKERNSDYLARDEAKRSHQDAGDHPALHRSGVPVSRELAAGRNQGRSKD